MAITRVLIFAGSDSSGGAGVQADLKVTFSLGGYGMTVITALTAQNTLGVQKIHSVPLEFVKDQFKSISSDIGFDAVKIGMLHSEELVKLVADLLADIKKFIVIDPVMVSKGGGNLLKKNAVFALCKYLLPKAYLLTPNLDETEVILGRKIRDLSAMAQAARDLVDLGARAVIVKGGHLVNKSADVLYDGDKLYIFDAPRIDTIHTHGTGCTLASACATLLAQGWKLVPAVKRARLLVRRAIIDSFSLGSGCGPVNVLADFCPNLRISSYLNQIYDAVKILETVSGLGKLLPKEYNQLGYAFPGAVLDSEVLTITSCVNIDGRIKAIDCPRVGISCYITRLILTIMKYDPNQRSAMILAFDNQLVERASVLGLSISESCCTEKLSTDIKAYVNFFMEKDIKLVVSRLGFVPDLIFDLGGIGKEPIIKLFAANPQEIVRKIFLLGGEK